MNSAQALFAKFMSRHSLRQAQAQVLTWEQQVLLTRTAMLLTEITKKFKIKSFDRALGKCCRNTALFPQE